MLVNVVIELFGQKHKVEIIPLLVLPLDMNSSNFLEVGPRGVGTAKREGSAIFGRRRSTNVFTSQKHQ